MRAIKIFSVHPGEPPKHLLTIASGDGESLLVLAGDASLIERLWLSRHGGDLDLIAAALNRNTYLSAVVIDIERQSSTEYRFSKRHYDENASAAAVEAMIEELVEEGMDRKQIMNELEVHALDQFPQLEQMVDIALKK